MRMRWTLSALVALAVGLAVPQVPMAQEAHENQAPGQKPPTPPPAPPATTKPGPDAPPPPPAAPAPDGRTRRVGPNVRIEVTFTEQRADGTAPSKTVTVTTGDGHWGRVRALAQATGVGGTPLNVDARPEMQQDGRVLLALTLEYGDKRVSQAEPPPQGVVALGPQRNVTDVTINQSVTVALESGKPLIITQAVDPMSDRKVTVEVKATVLR